MDPVALTALDLSEAQPGERAALVGLLAKATEAGGGDPPLPEPQMRAVRNTGRDDARHRLVLARHEGALVGASLLARAHDGSTVVHAVVDPGAEHRGEIADALLELAVAEAPAGSPVHLWAMDAGPGDDDRAAALGFSPERDLLQMRVALPLADRVVAATRPLLTRAFVPGRDEGVWVDSNNRAFEGHPEQGGWTVAQLRRRMAAEWVELDGFLLADDPDGPGIIGSCWTKIHRDRSPVLGEIYVIAVDPRHHGQGWGRSLTVAGLRSMADRGVTTGMLYTDASNDAAVALYRSLGFTVHHVDRSYRRDPRRASLS